MVAIAPLEVESLHFHYGAAPVLDDVTFRVEAGEGVALLGANGAGKTTLSRLAMALLQPSGGRVVTAGRDTAGRRPEDLSDAVGYLFQNPEAQLFARTVRAEVSFGPERMGWSQERIVAAVDGVLAELGLGALAERHPYDLPAPTRRLVALATALVADPQLLILDEPTAGLDRASKEVVAEVVLARRAQGAAVLVVTHDLGFAAETLDRALVLEGARLSEDVPLIDLLGRHPAYPAPPLVELARRLACRGVRPSIAALAPLLTSHPESGTLEA